MKLVSPLPHKRGRLEIIPLIDIMFFLLAGTALCLMRRDHIFQRPPRRAYRNIDPEYLRYA
jgi:hypothetical protein